MYLPLLPNTNGDGAAQSTVVRTETAASLTAVETSSASLS